jgi:hypothetical protein
LLNVRFGSLLGPLYLHVGRKLNLRKLNLRKPRDPSPCLLGLAYLAPASHRWYSAALLFDLLGNHCCRNKPTDALVSHTLLYYCRVIRVTYNKRVLISPNNLCLYFIYYIIMENIYLVKPYKCLFLGNKYIFTSNILLVIKVIKGAVESLVVNIFTNIFFNKLFV